MSNPQNRKPPQETRIWKAAYEAALNSLSESSEFTEMQRVILATAMAHAAFVVLPTLSENIAMGQSDKQHPSKD